MKPELLQEDRLLILLAKARLCEVDLQQSKALLGRSLRWDYLLAQGERLEVYPLLFRNLRDLGFPEVPPESRQQLESLYRANALRNHVLTQELIALLRLLGGAGIPVIPLKGVAFAESCYGGTHLRTCADIDILVPPARVAEAFRLLQAAGYGGLHVPWFFSRRVLANSFEYPLERRDQAVSLPVDLHWGLFWERPSRDGSAPEEWAEARPQRCFDVPAYGMSYEWQLLFLVIHAARHGWQGLKWRVDVHALLERAPLSWVKLEEKARPLGWEKFVRHGRDLFQAIYPEQGSQDLPTASARALSRWEPTSERPIENIASCIRLLDAGPHKKLGFVLRRIFIPTAADGEAFRLRPSLGWLYYVLRPLRLSVMPAPRVVWAALRKGVSPGGRLRGD